MTRIAHLSDLHLLESGHASRALRERLRLSLLTFGREIDPAVPRARFARALESARRARAEHVVVTGDLTEDGAPAQFEVLAEVLHDSGWDPDRVTLVPGNHDAYDREDAWDRALEGPLRAFARTSTPGSVTELGSATIVAISTAIHQPWLRAAGRVGDAQRARVREVLAREARSGRPVALAMHHPPFAFGLRLGWLEGLLDLGEVRALLDEHRHAHVLCGHRHLFGDHALGEELEPRVFSAHAVVEHDAPVRMYEAVAGRLLAIDDRAPTTLAVPSLAALDV